MALHRSVVVPLVVVVVQACSGSQSGGGGAATGGVSPSGGSTSIGGVSTAGNSNGTGGSSVGQGGTANTSATTSGTGGAAQIGGTANTGATTTSSMQSSGGTTTVGTTATSAMGGTKSSGGASTAGGTKSSGGTSATGGTKSGGGTSATGGTKSNGGTSAAGGTKSSGGTSATGGAKSSGTSTGSTRVCGTAAEDASATLTCPQGQIIDSVVFASYGTPTGTCGSFATGSCDSTSSKTMVESLCVGRSSCSVPASNGAFGDPCNKTTKHLNIEVSCVPGTPIVSTSPYKGVANSPASQLAALGATWCYNWGTTPKSTDCADPLFVPMIWDGSNVASALTAIGNAGYTTVLGFNEPNKSDQANMTVAAAIALWPTITSNPNIRVSSPAVSDDGRSWLVDFMTQVKANGLRVDFIAMHWYGWNAGSCTASQLEGAVNWASQWGLPVWITEFGCMGSSNPDEQTVLTFFNDAITMLNKHPLVERYAWYPWNTYNHLYDNDVMSNLGKAFAAAPQYRQ